MTALYLVYLEYENRDAPFAWLDGTEPEDHRRVHRLLSMFVDRKACTDRHFGRAVRYDNALLLETSWRLKHVTGARQRIVVVVMEVGENDHWVDEIAHQINEILVRSAAVEPEPGAVAEVLRWGWAETARRFPGRFVRRCLAGARKGFAWLVPYRGQSRLARRLQIGTGE